jgi:hypothetical protein
MFIKIHVESGVLYKVACYNLRYAAASSTPSDYLPAQPHMLPLVKKMYGSGATQLVCYRPRVCFVNKIHVESGVLYKVACYNLRHAVASSTLSDYLPAQPHMLPLVKKMYGSGATQLVWYRPRVCFVNKTQGVFICLNPKRTAVRAFIKQHLPISKINEFLL